MLVFAEVVANEDPSLTELTLAPSSAAQALCEFLRIAVEDEAPSHCIFECVQRLAYASRGRFFDQINWQTQKKKGARVWWFIDHRQPDICTSTHLVTVTTRSMCRVSVVTSWCTRRCRCKMWRSQSRTCASAIGCWCNHSASCHPKPQRMRWRTTIRACSRQEQTTLSFPISNTIKPPLAFVFVSSRDHFC